MNPCVLTGIKGANPHGILGQKAWRKVKPSVTPNWYQRAADCRVYNMEKEVSETRAGFSFVLGSRIASWLPSFSVEVMHTTNILGITQASNSQLNAMVSSLFWGVIDGGERRKSMRACAVCTHAVPSTKMPLKTCCSSAAERGQRGHTCVCVCVFVYTCTCLFLSS